MPEVIVVQHPLVQHKLALMRAQHTDSATFRMLMNEIAGLLAYELTRELPTAPVEVTTPLETMRAPMLAGPPPVLVSILRAGNGLLEGILRLIPTAAVAHVGLYRDAETLKPVQYYLKVPPDLPQRPVLVLDPMLATGHSASAAVSLLKEKGARSVRFLCLLAAPEGLRAFHAHHPDVPVVTASIDRALDERGYIVPGLGDAGDRLYGTTH